MFCCRSITTVTGREFVGYHFSHPLDVAHLQYQQFNDALINALTHALKN